MTDKMTDIKLDEVKVGRTMMSGYAGALGREVTGCIRRILPGICVEVEVGKGTALLWRKYQIESEDAKEQGRPDHPDEYRDMRAVVDCDFWVAQGIDPLFLATESDCFPGILPPSPTDLQEQLEDVRDLAESRGPNSLAAWNRQMASASVMNVSADRSPASLTTPPRSRRPEPTCPPAPTKRPLPQSDSDQEEDQKEEDSDFEEDNEDQDNEDQDNEDQDNEYNENDDQEEDQEDDEEDDDEGTYIPRRTLNSAVNLTEFVSAIEEFIYTEHVVIVSNKTIIAVMMIFVSMFALVILAKVR